MHTIVLGGFLGSGKTTFLLKLARFLVESSRCQQAYKLVIIENEIGTVGIDSKLLNASGLQVHNLFSGCACCTLSGSLVQTIERIRHTLSPEYIIVEASGVAIPGKLAQTIRQELGYGVQTMVLVDTSRWLKLLKPLQMVIPHQLAQADVVLLNKVDLVSAQTMRQVHESVFKFATGAQIIPISAAEPISACVMRTITSCR